ncbi:MAG: hypothetical protein II177_05720 [Lachnospiraceae bacterium]|nr:hypothetical protein [Lachnospiraceae bacterium]
MVIRTVVTVLLVILALLVYLIFIPIAFGAKGDFDAKSFKAYLHDPLRFIDLRYDTSLEEKFSLRIFYFIKPFGKKKEEKTGQKKKKKKRQKKKEKKPADKKKKLKDFIKTRLKPILKSIIGLLKKCRIHIDDCDIYFSTGEPDTTALIYGGLSSLPFMYSKSTNLTCDLMSDDAYIHGHLGARGTLHIAVVIYYLLKILFSGD